MNVNLLGLETTSTWKEVVTGPYGGQGGIWFTDWWQSLDGYDYHPKRPPQQINVRAGERVDMIQVKNKCCFSFVKYCILSCYNN